MKRFISILLLSLLAASVNAQVGDQRHDLCLGINGGVALNKVGFTPKINQYFHVGPTLGATVRYTSERYYGMYCAFQAEANVASLGWREHILSSRNLELPDHYSRHLTYLQVPILANLGFGSYSKGFKGYFVAGPQISYLLNDSERQSETWTVNGTIPDRMNGITMQYGKEVENALEYGITAGLGGEFTTKAGHFLLEGRYYMGLSNLYGNSKTDPFPKSNNSTISFKATYLFDVHRRKK